MDGIILANCFATIVNLLSIFINERKDIKTHNKQEFLLWLDEHGFKEIMTAISNSDQLVTEIDRLLHVDHEVIMSKLDGINDLLAIIAGRINAFDGLAQILRPGVGLSDQAIHFLKTLVHSKYKNIIKYEYASGGFILRLSNSNENVDFTEPRLVDDDLRTLTELGFLNFRVLSRGTETYGITRNAKRLVELIESESQKKEQSVS